VPSAWGPHSDGHVDAIPGPTDETSSPIDSHEIDTGFLRRAQRYIPRAVVVSIDRRGLVNAACAPSSKTSKEKPTLREFERSDPFIAMR